MSLSPGMRLALLAAVLSGSSIFYNKIVVTRGIDPLVFNILKNGGVALILTFLLLPSVNLFTSLTKHQWIKLFAIGGIGGSIPFVLFFEGLKMVSATQANLINKSIFLWVALLAVPLLKEKIKPIQVAGYMMLIGITVFLGGKFSFSPSRAHFMILTATMLWSAEIILSKWTMKSVPPLVVAWSRMFFGTLILLALALSQNKISLIFISLESTTLLPVLGSILFLTGYVISWYGALAKIPATMGTGVLALAPVITTLLSSLFITHLLPINEIASIILTAIAVLLIASLPQLHRARTV